MKDTTKSSKNGIILAKLKDIETNKETVDNKMENQTNAPKVLQYYVQQEEEFGGLDTDNFDNPYGKNKPK